jgi:hypothetical protein
MLYNLHSITEKKPIQTRSVRTPTDRKVVMETQLSAMNTKVPLLLTDVANGLYHYDISFLDSQQTQGKLLIQKK